MRFRLHAAIVVLLLATLAAGAAAQGFGGGSYVLEDGERNLKFAGVPVPNYSDVLGVSLGVVGMAYYKLDRHDDALPPSATGVFGFYSENNSWIGAAFQKLHYDHDNWRGLFAAGSGSVKYQFNPASLAPGLPDVFIDYTTATDFVAGAGSRRVWDRLYAGVGALTWSALVSTADGRFEVAEERYTGVVLTAEWDGRDNIMQPTDGHGASARWRVYDEAFGSDATFGMVSLEAAAYRSVGDSTRVIAARALGEIGVGDVPFSAQNIVSGTRNLRGYSDGRHRGERLYMAEVEYRWNFHGRWGATAFTGVAFVTGRGESVRLADALPAVGLGLRYRMVEAYRINARVDVAWGDGDQGIYVAVGEAF